jgi:hypothetical protein
MGGPHTQLLIAPFIDATVWMKLFIKIPPQSIKLANTITLVYDMEGELGQKR